MLILLLLFNSAYSTRYTYTNTSCARVQCPAAEPKLCIRMKRTNQIEASYKTSDKCELQYLKCLKDMDAIVVAKKYCNLVNDAISKRARKTDICKNEITKLSDGMNFIFKNKDNVTFRYVIDVEMYLSDIPFQLPRDVVIENMKLLHNSYYDIRPQIGVLVMPDNIYKESKTSQELTEIITLINGLQQRAPNLTECKKPVLTWTLEALAKQNWNSVDNSYLVVFTNALASDEILSKRIIELAKEYKVRVIFVIVPGCHTKTDVVQSAFQVYFRTASATGGQVLMARKNIFLNKYFEHNVLSYKPQVEISNMYLPGSRIPFYLPEDIPYVTVSASGSNVDLTMLHSTGLKDIDHTEVIINTDHTKLYKYTSMPPGNYVILLEKSIQYNNLPVAVNVIFSKMKFEFIYGLSSHPNTQLKYTKQVNDWDLRKPAYVIILVRQPAYDKVQVTKLKFLDEQGNVKQSHGLASRKCLYVTEMRVLLPTHNFSMILSGIISGKEINTGPVDVKIDQADEATSKKRPRPTTTYTWKTRTKTPTTTERWDDDNYEEDYYAYPDHDDTTTTRRSRTTARTKTRTTTTSESDDDDFYDDDTTTTRRRTTTTKKPTKSKTRTRTTTESDDDDFYDDDTTTTRRRTTTTQKPTKSKTRTRTTTESDDDDFYDDDTTTTRRRTTTTQKPTKSRTRTRTTTESDDDDFYDDDTTTTRTRKTTTQKPTKSKTRTRTTTESDDDDFYDDDTTTTRRRTTTTQKPTKSRTRTRTTTEPDDDDSYYDDTTTTRRSRKTTTTSTTPESDESYTDYAETTTPDYDVETTTPDYDAETTTPDYGYDSADYSEVTENLESDSEPLTTHRTRRTTCIELPDDVRKQKKKLAFNASLPEREQYSSCPEQCPVQNAMVCARCQHGVYRTFLSVCYMRMYQCRFPNDRLELVARKPCIASNPYIGPLPRPVNLKKDPFLGDVIMHDVLEQTTEPTSGVI